MMNNSQQPSQKVYFDTSGELHFPNGLDASKVDVVWVPTQLVLLTEVTVPGKRKSDWMRALPYALEESVSQPLDEVFIAVLHRVSSGAQQGLTSVAVVEKTLMQNWVEALTAAGLGQAQLVADCFQCPLAVKADEAEDASEAAVSNESNGSNGCYIEAGDYYLVRQGAWRGMAIPKSWQDLPQFSEWISQLCQAVSLAPSEVKALGLRQGAFQSQSQISGLAQSGWKLAAVSALVLVLWVTQNWMHASQNSAERQQVVTATEKLFKQMFPNVTRIVNIQAQTKTALARQQQPTEQIGPAALAILIEPHFQQAKQVKIEQFKWQSKRLVLSLKAKDNRVLQQLQNSLANQLPKQVKVELNIKKMQPNDILAEMILNVS